MLLPPPSVWLLASRWSYFKVSQPLPNSHWLQKGTASPSDNRTRLTFSTLTLFPLASSYYSWALLYIFHRSLIVLDLLAWMMMCNFIALFFLLACLCGVWAIAHASGLTYLKNMFSWLGSGCGAWLACPPMSLATLLWIIILVTLIQCRLSQIDGIDLAQASVCTVNESIW